MHGHRRYAVYFAPRPASVLGGFGAAWLGWDAERGRECPGLELEGLPRPRAELVAAPRRYGFHATLKAPFRVAEGSDAVALDAAVRALAAEREAFAVPLKVRALGPFLALTAGGPAAAVEAIAAACVERLDCHRAALSPEELARRAAQPLDARQQARLARWGYPYVFDTYTFHLTLTGPLPEVDQRAARAVLEATLAPVLAAPAPFEDLCLCGEDAAGMFRVLRRHPLRCAAAGRR